MEYRLNRDFLCISPHNHTFPFGSHFRWAILQAVIEANIIGPLVNLLQNAEFDIKKEAAWAISNATSGGSHDQIKYGAHKKCLLAYERNFFSSS